MECREGCAACCIAPSISSAIPGMPSGKPAGVPCIQLNEQGLCKIFGKNERPKVCGCLQANLEMCGQNKSEALEYLTELERLTAPIKVKI
jgi:Fe-S-cluster containining protein